MREFFLSLLVELGRLVKRCCLLGAGGRQGFYFAVARREQLARFSEALLDLRQPVEDGLLENAPGILVLLDAHLLIGDRFGQFLYLRVAAIDLYPLTGSRKTRVLELGLQPVQFHRKVGAQAIFVSPDFSFGERQRPLQGFSRKALNAALVGRQKDNHDQGRDKKAQCHEHRGVKGYQEYSP